MEIRLLHNSNKDFIDKVLESVGVFENIDTVKLNKFIGFYEQHKLNDSINILTSDLIYLNYEEYVDSATAILKKLNEDSSSKYLNIDYKLIAKAMHFGSSEFHDSEIKRRKQDYEQMEYMIRNKKTIKNY
jgi:hypothetical protein